MTDPLKIIAQAEPRLTEVRVPVDWLYLLKRSPDLLAVG